jgi:hypothetical protein
MHFLLLILRLVLGLVPPAWRNSLLMAARADGRVEHHSQRPGLWARWLGEGWLGYTGRVAQRRSRPALAVRASGAAGNAPPGGGSSCPSR